MIKIVVCVKLIIDPEAPLSVFKIDREAMKIIPPEGMPLVNSYFDEHALEEALRIKDKQDSEITVVTMGPSIPKALVQRILALGIDKAIAIEGPEFENLDPFSTAQGLSNAIKKMGEYDLIFTGRQAADWDAGLVWAGIVESLGLPSITMARKAEVRDGKVIVERVVTDGIEVLETDIPVLISFTNEVGELRNISLSALMKVKKREIPKWTASDINLEVKKIMEMRDFYIPTLREVDCHVISGESTEDKGRNLMRKLVEDGIIL